MNTKERILQFIDYKKISKRKFYLKTGLSNGFLDKVLNIGSDKIEIILSCYPEINPKWLISGEGDMIYTRIFPNVPIEEENKMMDEIMAGVNLLNKLIKSNKNISEIERSYKDTLISIELIESFLNHYYIQNQMNIVLEKYRMKKILMDDVKEAFKNKFTLIQELHTILEPYKAVIDEVYKKLYDFDDNHDRIYYMEE